jgi:prepilin-type N-terminal cleavage/methylation domain-containing protein
MRTTHKRAPQGSRGRQAGLTVVELLVAMAIMSIITAMILVSWFALSRSYAYSATSNKAREHAREAIARIEREVRDAQSDPDSSEAALLRAHPRTIVVTTTFNVAGNDSPVVNPRIVMYRLYPDRELWRFADTDADGVISGVDMDADGWPANPYLAAEQETGEGGRLLVGHVVNDIIPSTDSPTPLFRYSYYETDGDLVQATSISGVDRGRVVSVQINLMVDLNPARSPIYTEFQTTAQLRNQQ